MVDSPVTSVALSPRADFLVTTHIGDLGVYLWSNMTLYKHVSLHPLPADFEPSVLSLPSTSRKSTGRDNDVLAGVFLFYIYQI